VGIVARAESSIKSSVPARIFDAGMVTPISRRKSEEMLEFEEI
jgi:hypothetical protein